MSEWSRQDEIVRRLSKGDVVLPAIALDMIAAALDGAEVDRTLLSSFKDGKRQTKYSVTVPGWIPSGTTSSHGRPNLQTRCTTCHGTGKA